MKMAANNSIGLPWEGGSQLWGSRYMVAATIAMAVALGASAAEEKWYVFFALAAIPLVLFWPVEVALGGFALLFPFDAILVLGNNARGTTLTWFVGVAAAGVLAVRLLTGLREHPPQAVRWWAAFVVWGTISSLWAMDSQTSLLRLPNAWSLLLFYAVAVSSRVGKQQLQWVVNFSIVGGCAAALYVIRGFSQGIFFPGGSGVRASLIMGDKLSDPNYFATMLLLPLSLAIGYFLSCPGRMKKVLLSAVIAIIGYSIFVTMSRGTLFGLGVLVLVYVFRLRFQRRVVVPIALVLVLLIAAAPEGLWMRLQGSQLHRAAGRLDIWIVGLNILKHHGLFGVGINNFPLAYNRYAGSAVVFPGFTKDSHNTFLNVSAELGLVGFLLFFFALRSEFIAGSGAPRKGNQNKAPPPMLVACEAACFGILAAGFFIDVVWTKVFWFSMILLILTARVSLQDTVTGEKPTAAVAR
jgi:O-antigen ligase